MGHVINILLFMGSGIVFGISLSDMSIAYHRQDMLGLVYGGFFCIFALLFAKFVFDVLPKYESTNQEATSRTTEEN